MLSENGPLPAASARLFTTLQCLFELSVTQRGQTLHRIAQVVAEALGGELAIVFLFDTASRSLTAQGTSMTTMGGGEQAIGLDRLPLEEGGQIVEVYQTGHPYSNGQADRNPVGLTELKKHLGIKSEIAVPLEIATERRGVLFAASHHPNYFTERDREFLKTVSRWIGTMLHQAEQVEQHIALLQLAHDAFIVQDERNCITFWSQGAASLYGWSEQEAVGKVARNLLHTQFPLPISEIHAILRGEKVWQGELEHTTRTGKHLVVDSRWQLIEQSGGSSLRILEVNRDITERTRLEHQKDEFIKTASHELKTPITSLKAFTQLLQRRLTKQGDEQGRHYLESMDSQLDRLNSLISDLLDLSRMESGKMELRLEPICLDTLIDETVENMQAVTSTHCLLVEGRTNCGVLGDKDRLGQVVVNLLSNAIKYSPDANTIVVRLSQDGEQAMVSVQDFGIGIEKSQHESLFERFYQVTDPSKKNQSGLGIGLHIAKEIVERHHGRIWVESSTGKGSTFFVAIPVYREGEAGRDPENS